MSRNAIQMYQIYDIPKKYPVKIQIMKTRPEPANSVFISI